MGAESAFTLDSREIIILVKRALSRFFV